MGVRGSDVWLMESNQLLQTEWLGGKIKFI